jgi:methyl-accepting chemotaxis protein
MSKFLNLFRYNQWPIATKLIVVMLLIAVVPLAIIGFVNARNTTQILNTQIGTDFKDLATGNATVIGRDLTSVLSDMTHMATFNDVLWKSAEAQNQSYTGTNADNLAKVAAMDPVWMAAADTDPLITNMIANDPAINPVAASLFKFQEMNPKHVEVFITDKYGALVGSTDRTSDYNQADEGWWQTAWNNGQGGVYIGEPEFDESTKTTAVNMAVPIRNPEDVVVGVFRTTLNVTAVSDELAKAAFGQTGDAIVIDKQGKVLFSPDPEKVGKAAYADLGFLAAGQSQYTQLTGDEGYPVLAGFAQVTSGGSQPAVDNLGWIYLVEQGTSEALAPVQRANTVAILSILLAALAAVLVSYFLSRTLTTQIRHIMDMFSQIGMGDFNARAKVTSGDELGSMATSLNAMLENTLTLIQTREQRDAIQSAIMKLLEEVSGVAEGDLTREAEVTTEVTGAIADSFNYMIAELRRIIQSVQATTQEVTSSATEIRSTTEHLSQGSEAQAYQIIETSKAVKEMADSITQVSENAVQSASVSQQALDNARRGAKAVQDTILGMNRIRDQVQETAKRIKRLGESSQEIGEIVQLIEDIADRTSILALNASIQAAMAGEAGRGFAVVAEEVERLAERSTDATKQIAMLIKTTQTETTEAVAAMEATTHDVVTGSQLADQAGQALGEIENVSNNLAELIQSISMASKQQARGSENLARSMTEISDVTQQTAAGTRQAAVAINELATLADQLRTSVSRFKLPSNGHAA